MCGAAPLTKVLHPVPIHFKGSGFYSTDYGRGSRKRDASEGDGGGEEGREEDGQVRRSRRRRPPRARADGPAARLRRCRCRTLGTKRPQTRHICAGRLVRRGKGCSPPPGWGCATRRARRLGTIDAARSEPGYRTPSVWFPVTHPGPKAPEPGTGGCGADCAGEHPGSRSGSPPRRGSRRRWARRRAGSAASSRRSRGTSTSRARGTCLVDRSVVDRREQVAADERQLHERAEARQLARRPPAAPAGSARRARSPCRTGRACSSGRASRSARGGRPCAASPSRSATRPSGRTAPRSGRGSRTWR